jgi:hypothetical protein
MESSLQTVVEKVSAVAEGEPGWSSAVARAARLIEPRWPTREWSAKYPWALQTLALLLYTLDRDEQLDDPAALTALAPYVHTQGAEYLHTVDAVAATRALFSGNLPDDGRPLSRLITSLTTRPEIFEVPDLPSMETPDFRMPLVIALQWLDYGLQESTQSA